MQLWTPIPDKIVDLSGYRCPHLLIATIKASRSLGPGEILKIIATDLRAPSSLSAWARQSDYQLLQMYDEENKTICFLQFQEEIINVI